jgi:serine/threonine protein kinase
LPPPSRNAHIYTAMERSTRRAVVLKVYKKGAEMLQEKIQQESRLLCAMSGQQGIINMVKQFDDETQHYIVLEACPGTLLLLVLVLLLRPQQT